MGTRVRSSVEVHEGRAKCEIKRKVSILKTNGFGVILDEISWSKRPQRVPTDSLMSCDGRPCAALRSVCVSDVITVCRHSRAQGLAVRKQKSILQTMSLMTHVTYPLAA